MGQIVIVGTEPKVTGGDVSVHALAVQGLSPHLRAGNRYVQQVNAMFVVQADVARRQIDVKNDGLLVLEHWSVSGLLCNRNPIGCPGGGGK